ncbi:MAG: metalloregulator ArsR/SmtB family transcription factor [Candidatus Undinarchaeales archaeon]
MKDKIKILKSISDETRLKIISLLLGGEKCVCEIFPKVDRAQPTVSLQLKKLEEADILEKRKDGRRIFYKIKDERIKEILKILENGG